MKKFFTKPWIVVSFLCLMSTIHTTCHNYYGELGLNKNASQEEIKIAYRTLARTKHPNIGGSPEEFAKISNAHDILKDADLKKVYDLYLSSGHNLAVQMVKKKIEEQEVQRQEETLMDDAKNKWRRERDEKLVKLEQKAHTKDALNAEQLYHQYLNLLNQYVVPKVVGTKVNLQIKQGFISSDAFELDQFAGEVIKIYGKMIKKYFDEQKYTQAKNLIKKAQQEQQRLENLLAIVPEGVKDEQSDFLKQVQTLNAILALKPEEVKTEQEKLKIRIAQVKENHKNKLKRAREFAKEKKYQRAENALRVYINNFPTFDTKNPALLVLQATQLLEVFNKMHVLYGLSNADNPQRALDIINKGLSKVNELQNMLQKHAPFQNKKSFDHQVIYLKRGKQVYEDVLAGHPLYAGERLSKALNTFSQSLHSLADQLQS